MRISDVQYWNRDGWISSHNVCNHHIMSYRQLDSDMRMDQEYTKTRVSNIMAAVRLTCTMSMYKVEGGNEHEINA